VQYLQKCNTQEQTADKKACRTHKTQSAASAIQPNAADTELYCSAAPAAAITNQQLLHINMYYPPEV
jgi:hypothetical protein